jgi:hypothetical protein
MVAIMRIKARIILSLFLAIKNRNPKFKVQIKSKIQMSKYLLFFGF